MQEWIIELKDALALEPSFYEFNSYIIVHI